MRPCWGLWDEVLASSRSGVRTLLTARTKYRWLSRVCVHGGCDIECRWAWVGAGVLCSKWVVQLDVVCCSREGCWLLLARPD